MVNCAVCGTEAKPAFTAIVLGKYASEFFTCPQCGFLQSSNPYWLEEAYTDAIATADTGLVQRNDALSCVVSQLLFWLFPPDGLFLDIAGGYGLFVRKMRDIGFDFFWSDKYCKNLLARGFEDRTGCTYNAITAFEVIEHVSDPVQFIQDALESSGSGSIIFSTELFDGPPPKPGEWWYYAFEAGQHISFYQRRTLEALANRLGMRLYSRGSIHMLTNLKIRSSVFSALTNRWIARLLSWIPHFAMDSRTMADHLYLLGKSP